jgi:CubicO group peptidase (beta-lactamase class C family)
MIPHALADLDAKLRSARQQAGCPGLTFAASWNGESWSAADGVVNVETGIEARPDSLFQVGSITKAMTATLVMQAAAEGLLDLDQPVSAYIDSPLGRGDHSGAFTARQLMAHLSGLDGDLFLDTGRDDDALAKYMIACADLEFLCPPGAHYNYANAGYAILGRLLEVLRGAVFDQILRERLLTPLGSTRSTTFAEDAAFARTAVGHTTGDDGAPQLVQQLTLPRSLGPAGLTLYSTVEDLLAFAGAHMSGRTPVSPQIAAAMRTPHVELADGTYWGLGWKLIGEQFVGHDGGTIGQAAFLWTAPEHGLAVTLCANGGNARAAWEALAHPVFQEICGAIPHVAAPEPSRDPCDLSIFEGRYTNVGVDVLITVQGDQLEAIATQSAFDAPPIIFHMRPLGDGRFRAVIGEDDNVITAFLDFDAAGRPELFYAGRLHRRRAS